MWLNIFWLLLNLLLNCVALDVNAVDLADDYFRFKGVKFVAFLSCSHSKDNKNVSVKLQRQNIRVSVTNIRRGFPHNSLHQVLNLQHVPIGVILDTSCDQMASVMKQASKASLLDSVHMWLLLPLNSLRSPVDEHNCTIEKQVRTQYQRNCTENGDTDWNRYRLFQNLNLSVDTDIAVANIKGDGYELADIFNFGKIQGNPTEVHAIGGWSTENGLDVQLKGFKYYDRWDFHNLTLRGISVVLQQSNMAEFNPEVLTADGYQSRIPVITKVAATLLELIRKQHNFRFKYTIADRWVGSPAPNSTLAVTNAIYWRQQDISVTSLRIFPQWLAWVDPVFPPVTFLEWSEEKKQLNLLYLPGEIGGTRENDFQWIFWSSNSSLVSTKFFYLISSEGVGRYENRFLTPMSPSVWWSALTAGFLCTLVLTAAARFERRPAPGLYAVFSVLAASCQQAYDDGVQIMENAISSQGRKMTLFVIGCTSMMLYNFYTSSVVSWLLNAAAPTISSIDGLISSKLELIFEDVGYTKGWLDGPGFYYYSGFKWDKEDELRDKKVNNVKLTVPLLQSPEAGVELVRSGKHAFHSEPYTANQAIGRSFQERELCELGTLQMMRPAPTYVVVPKRSPYKQFFVWSFMRAKERGHLSAVQKRISGTQPSCSGQVPRALALGQAAPAFVVLALAMLLSGGMLVVEILHHRYTRMQNLNLHRRVFLT